MNMHEKIFIKALGKQINFWQDVEVIKREKPVGNFCKAPAQCLSALTLRGVCSARFENASPHILV